MYQSANPSPNKVPPEPCTLKCKSNSHSLRWQGCQSSEVLISTSYEAEESTWKSLMNLVHSIYSESSFSYHMVPNATLHALVIWCESDVVCWYDCCTMEIPAGNHHAISLQINNTVLITQLNKDLPTACYFMIYTCIILHNPPIFVP